MKPVTQTERTAPRPAGGRATGAARPLASPPMAATPCPARRERAPAPQRPARAGSTPAPAPPRAPASQARSRASSARVSAPRQRDRGAASFVPTPLRTYKAGARAPRPLFPRGAPAMAAHGVMERRCSLVPSTLYIKHLMEGPSQVEEYLGHTSGFS
ncbi:60S ribosomal protein L22-like [Motacilla alba alba]|uniref:60S ribosomal protein L22-like n=1 Tax=Motacilla alba alba TaxID=1094192 RepID=UPI0018D576E5|nr:60S ribosomal protein L22-like [Motacilla alba alba]